MGKTLNVCIPLKEESFEWFDNKTNKVHPIKGDYELLYGGSSSKETLKVVPVSITSKF